MREHKFTHIGTLSGDARSGDREFRTKLRLTPSGSHWVDPRGRKYPRRGGGYVGEKWPMWFLDADSIREIAASVDTDPKGGDAKQAPCASIGSAVGVAETPNTGAETDNG